MGGGSWEVDGKVGCGGKLRKFFRCGYDQNCLIAAYRHPKWGRGGGGGVRCSFKVSKSEGHALHSGSRALSPLTYSGFRYTYIDDYIFACGAVQLITPKILFCIVFSYFCFSCLYVQIARSLFTYQRICIFLPYKYCCCNYFLYLAYCPVACTMNKCILACVFEVL